MRYFDDFPVGASWGQRRGMIAPRKVMPNASGERHCLWCGDQLPADRRRARACDVPKGAEGYSCEAKLLLVTSWVMLRQLVIERDGGVCALCGNSAYPYEVDHIRRVVDGGTDDPKNLRTLCHTCHIVAGICQRAGEA